METGVNDPMNHGTDVSDKTTVTEENIPAPIFEDVVSDSDLVIFKKFDYKNQYSDEYYEKKISEFVPNTKSRFFYRFIKRSFDIVASFLGLVLLSPLMLVIAILIKCDSKGPVLFKQKRMGKNQKTFNCYKFRSMVITAPRNCATSELENPEQYYTKIGRFLRRFSLDELPQLFCVLVGTMSLIGYRPLVLNEKKCNAMRARLGVFAMRPGISGYAQVNGRDDVYYKNKALMDAEYVKNASILLDLKLLFQTVAVVWKSEGNNSEKKKKETETETE